MRFRFWTLAFRAPVRVICRCCLVFTQHSAPSTQHFHSLGALTATVLIVALATAARADVRLPALISENMVLQREKPAHIWGWADPGEDVRVVCQDQAATARANDRGEWSVDLKPLKAGGPYAFQVIGQSGAVSFDNVLVGEVWIASGQSNMEWPLSQTHEAESHIQAAHRPNIRLFKTPHLKADAPVKDVEARWQVCSPESVRDFSAIAYFLGRDLHKALDVPIGLIQTSWGGSPAEVWTAEPILAGDPELKPILDAWPETERKYQEALEEYEAKAEEAKPSGAQPPRRPGQPWKPAELYNGMIAPLTPGSIRGAIWYQGESNAGRARQYQTLFAAMIRNWREAWGQSDFPFLLVQLAPFMKIQPEPGESAWAELREAQFLATQQLPHVAMAVITDVGDQADIHPRKKEPVGQRLARAALAIAYGKDVVYAGPTFDRMEIEGNAGLVHFTNVGGGLEAREGELTGFAIAGEDGKWRWAKAEIVDRDTIRLTAKGIEKPAAVRFGWADYPVVNLWNKDGLPAVPFRTDRE